MPSCRWDRSPAKPGSAGVAPVHALAAALSSGSTFERRALWRGAATMLAAWLSSCAPALSSFTPAHVTRVKGLQAEGGVDVSYSRGAVAQLIDVTRDLARGAGEAPLDEDQRRRLIQGATALLLSPPSVVSHIGLAVGVAEDAEVQGRLTSGGFRLGGRYQFLHQEEHGVDLSSGLGIGRIRSELVLLDTLDLVEFQPFVRFQFDVPILVGRSGEWYRWWAGPRLMFVTYDSGLSVELPPVEAADFEGSTIVAELDGHGVYVGAQAGVALGYQHVFLAVELTLAHFAAQADVGTSGTGSVGSVDLEGSGAVIHPGVALMLEF